MVPSGSQSSTWSFVAYIHRNTPQPSHYCTGRYMQEYFYHGSTGAGPFVRTYTIPSTGAGTTKSIDVTIPVAEMTNDSRKAIIRVEAGGVFKEWQIQSPDASSSTYNNDGSRGHALNILKYTLTNVPGTVTTFTVSTTSPSSGGDSFITGGSVVTVNDVCTTVENCLTNGDEDGDGKADCADTDCAPVINSVTSSNPTCAGNSINGSITINATQAPNGNSGIQYCLTSSSTGTGSCVWQNSNIFNGLTGGVNYYVWVKDVSTTCEVAYINNPIVLTNPSCGGCTNPIELAHWDMDACTYDNYYTEFTPDLPSNVCLTATNVSRNNVFHSCRSGQSGSAPCTQFTDASFNPSTNQTSGSKSNNPYIFDVVVPVSKTGFITGFEFYHNLQAGPTGTKFGLAVWKDGTKIYDNANEGVSSGSWVLESVNFSAPQFAYTGGETYTFVVHPHNSAGTTMTWEVDEFKVFGCVNCGPPPSTCSPSSINKMIEWKTDVCQAFNPGSYDYSEFVASTPFGASCPQITGSNLYRDNPSVNNHSCNPGRAGGDGVAFCMPGLNDPTYNPGSDKALKFHVYIPANHTGSIDHFTFWSIGQNPTPFINSASINNNYPTKYGLRVLKDGVQIYNQSDFTIDQVWTLETIYFGSDPDFTYTGGEDYEFQLLAYAPVGNGYSVSIWDVDEFSIYGCCSEPQTPPCGTITGVTPQDPTSCNTNNGQIFVQTQGFTDPQFSLDGGATYINGNAGDDHTFTGLAPGYYNIVVRESDGTCITPNATNPIELTAPQAPGFSLIDFTNVDNCSGTCNGTISLAGSGGNGTGYEYSIDNGSNWSSNPNYTGLCAGMYNVWIRNGDQSCPIQGPTIPISAPNQPVIANVIATSPQYCPDNVGTIEIVMSNQNGAYLFSIDGGATWQQSNIFLNVPPGTYNNIKVKNVDGSCEVAYSGSVTINPLSPPVITNVNVTQPTTCNGTGSITITATASPGQTLEYSVDGGQTWQSSGNFPNLPTGPYLVQVRYATGFCVVNGGFYNIASPDAPIISNVIANDPTDCDDDDGSITVVATGGSGTLEYSINNGASWTTNSSFNGLSTGTYTVKVRYVGGTCEVTWPVPVTLTAPIAPIIVNIFGSDPTDCGLTDGSIIIDAYHPTATLEYSIDGGASWSVSHIFLNLPGGNYHIKVRHASGICEVDGGTLNLKGKVAPTLTNVAHTDPTDCNTNDGTITVTANGNSGNNIEYSINGGINWQSSGSFTGLPAGTYNVVIRNTDGTCEVVWPSNPIILVAPSAPTVSSIASTDPTDCGLSDGTITITASGNGALEYKITGQSYQSSNLFTGLAGGTYDVYVRNSDGSCEVFGGTVVLVDKVAPVIYSVTPTDVTDCGANDGTITINALSTQPVLYSIDGGTTWQPSNYFDNLPVGIYNISVKNVDGTCQVDYTSPVSIEGPEQPVITNVIVDDPTDCNSNDAQITVQVATPTSPLTIFEFSIDGGINWQTSNFFQNLTPGTYNIAVRNVDGSCITFWINNPVIITAPSAPTITGTLFTDPTDCGVSDGTITILATGGTPPLEYKITGSNWQTSNMFSNLSGGTYEIFVRNQGPSCEVTGQPVVLTDKVAPVIFSASPTDVTDCGLSDGTITVVASSSVGNALEYSINNGGSWQAGNFFAGLPAGSYNVLVRNADGSCEVGPVVVVVDEPSLPVILSVMSTDPTDCESDDGIITINVSGGTNVEYSIDGGINWNTNNVFASLPAGTYNIVVRNGNGTCEVYHSNNPVVLTAPSAPTILGVQSTDPTDCGVNDGTITIYAQGGTPPLEYSIDGGSTWQSSNIFNNLAEGVFNIVVRNAGNPPTTPSSCEVITAPVVLTAPVPPVIASVSSTDPTDCNINDGTITIIASGQGGLLYSIDDGTTYQSSNVFVGLAGGSYTIKVKNANGSCEVEYPNVVILTAPIEPIIANVIASPLTDCDANDGKIEVQMTTTHPVEYSIDGGINWQLSNMFPNLQAGTYNVVVRNVAGNCEVYWNNNPVILDAPSAPQILNVVDSDPTECGVNDGTITITATGGSGSYQYSIDGGLNWSNTTGMFTGLAAGTYDIRVRNAGPPASCEVIAAPVVLVAPVPPVLVSTNFTNPTDCGVNDGTITMVATTTQGGGGVLYSIDGGATWHQSGDFTGLAPGNYDLLIMNLVGNCEVDVADVTLVGPPQTTIVSVTSTDPSNCGVSDGTITITATGGVLEYSIDGGVNWFTNGGSFTGLADGVYNIFVRNVGPSCEIAYDQNPVVLTSPSAPSIFNVTYTDPTECGVNDGTITITASGTSGTLEYSNDGGLTFQASNVFTGLAAGSYDIVLQYNNGTCPVTYPPVILTAPVLPVIALIEHTDVTDCGVSDGTITITATGGVSLQYSIDGGTTWQPSNFFSGLGADTYDVRVRNITGNCEVTGAATTIDAPTPTNVTNVVSTDPTDCGQSDGQIEITATGGTLEYSIDGGLNWQLSSVFPNLPAGTYNVAVRNVDGTCFSFWMNNPVILSTPTSPQITNVASTDPTDCNVADGTITVSATGGQGSYEYSKDGGLTWQASNTFTGLAGGSYDIQVKNANGSCIVQGPVVVLVDKISPVVVSIGSTHPTDCGVNDGTITIVASSGQGTVEYSINDGATWSQSGSFVGLSAGNYKIKVRNIDGSCEITSPDIDLVAPIPPSITTVVETDPTNCNVADGTITITTTGGNGTTEYSIDGGQTWQQNGGNYTGLQAGTYFVWARNANGTCEVAYTSNPVILQPASAPAITNVSSTDPTDCNVTDGTITITVTGGNGAPYDYSIDGGGTWTTGTGTSSHTFTNLSGGSYDIQVRNGDETCIVVGPTEVLEDKVAPVISNSVGTDPTDCGVADGTITVTAYSPIGNALQYSIDGGASWHANNIFVGLNGGTYDIRVRNADGTCEETGSPVILIDKVQPTVDNVVATNPTDCNLSDGTITITASGNNIIEFSIDGGLNWQATGTFNNLAAGTYNVAVRYTDGTCFVLDPNNPVILGTPASPSIINVASTDPTDCGECDGTITVTATGGQGSYQYSKDGGLTWQSSNVFSNLCADAYDIAIRNADMTCVVLGSTEVLEDKVAPTISSVSSTNPTDCGVADGTITILASSSVGNSLEYSIDGGLSWQASNIFIGLTGDTYEIRVRNADGTCVETAPNEVLIDKISPIIEDVAAVAPSDCGMTDGSITITATAGSAAVEYSIDGGTNWYPTGVFTNLAPGAYNIFIRNADGTCVVANTLAAANNGLNNNTNPSSGYNPVIITPPTAPAITNVSSTNPTDCNVCDGTLTITATGGSGTYEYSNDGGLTWIANGGTFTALCGGSYETMVRNAGGSCETVGPIEVLEDKVPPIFTSAVGTDVTDCGLADGTIIVTANSPIGNALQYSIDNGANWQSSNVFSGLVASTYPVQVRNADGTCVINGTIVTIDAPVQPAITNVTSQNVSNCGASDGMISIVATFAATPGAEFSIDGGLNWQVGNTFTNLPAGTYNIAVRNVDGTCFVLYNQNPVIITAPSAPSITNVTYTDPTDCNSNDGTITVTATGGSGTYQYSNDGGATWQASNVFTGLAGGTYTTAVRNMGPPATCEVVGQSVTLTDKVPPVINNVVATNPTDCGVTDGTIIIDATSAAANVLEYSIDGGLSWFLDNTFVGLSGDTYEIRVRNADGTCEQSAPNVILIDKVQPVISSVVETSPTNCGVADGSIVVNAIGASLEYSIDGGINWQASNTFSGLGDGTYNVIVRNTDGSCVTPYANNPVILTSPSAPSITNVASTNPTDCNVADGTITVTATGAGALEYSNDGGGTWQSSNVFTNLAGGSYDIMIRNAGGGCEVVGPTEVLEDKVPPVFTSAVGTDITDCGVADGTITITASSPIGNAIQYSIDGGGTWQSSNVFSGLPAGSYPVAVRNADGTCIVNGTIVVLEAPVQPVINDVVVTPETNCGTADGTISVVATFSPTPGAEFSIDGGVNWQNSSIFTGLSAGTYNVAVRNLDGTCVVLWMNNPVIITAPSAPSITNISSTDPTDCGQCDGTITITSTGGTAPLEYTIDGGLTWQSSNVFTNLCGDDYTIGTRNAGPPTSCEVFGQTITLEDKVAPVINDVVASTDPTDCGVADGTITIDASSAAANVLEYSINGGLSWQLGNTFTALAGDTYEIRVRNADETCEVSNPDVVLIDKVQPVITSVTPVDPSNCGVSDGSITIAATGASLEYSIDGGVNWQSSNTFTGLADGIYNIIVRNADGSCVTPYANNPVVLTSPSAPSITNVASTNPTDCNVADGTITVTASGAGALEYSINGGAWQTSNVFDNLAGGSYDIMVRNAGGGCEVTGPTEVLIDKVPPVYTTYTSTDPLDCGIANGTITITANSPVGNAIQYSIDAGGTWQSSNVFSGLTGGQYPIAIRNADGTCIVLGDIVTLNTPVQPNINSVTSADPSNCGVNDGMISIVATFAPVPGVEFSIDGGLNWQVSNTFTSLGTGSYNIAVRNVDGTCLVLYTNNPVILTAPSAPSITNVTSTNPTDCGVTDGTITVTAAGGSGSLVYSNDGGATWQPSNVFTGLSGGTYDIAVANTGNPPTCIVNGQSVTLEDKVAPVVNDVTYTDPTDCGVTDGTITIDASSSAGNVLEYSINGGLSWQLGNNFTALAGGTYDIRVRNADGTCEVPYPSVTLIDKTTPTITNVAALPPSDCGVSDGSIVITASGASIEYSIDGGINWQPSNTFSGLGDGTYNVFVRNTDGSCMVAWANNPVIISSSSAPSITSILHTQPTECSVCDGTITITAAGGSGSYEYSNDGGGNWSPSGSFTGLCGGNYDIKVRNAGGSCEVTGQTIILIDKQPAVIDAITANDPSDCGLADGEIIVNATSPTGEVLQYSIDGGSTYQLSPTFSGLTGDTYNVSVRNADGSCEVVGPAVVLLDKIAPIINQVVSTDPTDCNVNDGTIQIAATFNPVPGIEFSIDGGINWQVSNVFTGLASGTYNVVIRNVDGTCMVLSVDNPIILEAPSAPTVSNILPVDPSDCNVTDGSIQITAVGGSGNYLYSIDCGATWSPNSLFTGLSGGTYQVAIQNADGTCETMCQTVVLTDKVAPTINSVTSTDPTDCGVADGTISINASSSAANVLEYSIDGGLSWQLGNTFVALSGGTYQIRVRNADETCEVSAPNEILIDKVQPVITNVAATAPSKLWNDRWFDFNCSYILWFS